MKKSFLQSYSSILLLIAGLIIGSIAGILMGEEIKLIKPVGDIFINLLFTVVVPLVFFAIASAIANIDRSKNFGKLIIVMLLVFTATELIAASVTVMGAWLYPVHQELAISAATIDPLDTQPIGDQITQLVTVNDFFQLLSRKSMLALIIFSILIGFAVLKSAEKGKPFRDFLNSGNDVMEQFLQIIMKIAPIGLGAYFAYQVGTIGPQLFGTYGRAMTLFHSVALFYFFFFFSLYAFIGGGFKAIKRYWSNNIIPSATSLSTCSSIATIPANLEAANKMGIPDYIKKIVVPLGGPLHKDGSAIASIIKIVVVFAMFNKPFAGVETIAIALGISVIVSVVEGGIPIGGYIGEVLMIQLYGFPPEALPVAMIVGTLVDPLTTVLNATGDNAAAMMIARVMKKKMRKIDN